MEKINLQLFAQPDGGAAETSAPETKPEVITYTEEQLNEKLSEAASKAKADLDSARASWEEEYKQKLEDEKAEAARLAKLSENERLKAQLDKERAKLEQDKAEFAKKALENEVAKQLLTEKLDPSFAVFLTGADAETSKMNIQSFKAAFDKAVEASVNERLKGGAPSASAENKTVISGEDKLNAIFGL